MRSLLQPLDRLRQPRWPALQIALAVGGAALCVALPQALGLWQGQGAPVIVATAIALMLACVGLALNQEMQIRGEQAASEPQAFDAPGFLAESAEAAFVMGLDGKILAANAHFAALTALDPDEASGCGVTQALPGPIVEAMTTALDHSLETTGAVECKNKIGEWLTVDLIWQPCDFGATPALAFTMRDLTERRRREVELAMLAFEDPLTKVGNRAAIWRRLDRLKADLSEGPEASFAIMALDLDGFKPINDQFGHAAGDSLLAQVARRIVDALPGNAFVGRTGGDEFVVVLGPRVGHAAARQFAQRLLDVIRQPISLKSGPVAIGVSIGIALAPADGEDGNKLLDAADGAMYRAKRAGGGIAFLSEAQEQAEAPLRSVA